MYALNHSDNQEYAIFATSTDRMAHVINLVSKVPHKWVIGYYNDQFEPSCLLEWKDFVIRMGELGIDQETYLRLGPYHPRRGRKASLGFFDSGKEHDIGYYRQVSGPPQGPDNAFTFDPSNGMFYAIEDESEVK